MVCAIIANADVERDPANPRNLRCVTRPLSIRLVSITHNRKAPRAANLKKPTHDNPGRDNELLSESKFATFDHDAGNTGGEDGAEVLSLA